MKHSDATAANPYMVGGKKGSRGSGGSGGSGGLVDAGEDEDYGRNYILLVKIIKHFIKPDQFSLITNFSSKLFTVFRHHARDWHHRWHCECCCHGAGRCNQQLYLLPEEEALLQHTA